MAENPHGGRVGDAHGAEGVEIDGVIAAQFEVFEAPAASEEFSAIFRTWSDS
jgi:hypothetical protein